MDEYLKQLILQYKKATGYKNIKPDSDSFILEFCDWIREMKKFSNNYIGLLDSMGLFSIREANTAEIGKGEYDSIVVPFETTIITPYTEGLKILEPLRVFKSGFAVCQETPVLMGFDGYKEESEKLILPTDATVTFMTQNPYNERCIKGWENLHNSGRYNIVLGAYGHVADRNLEEKVTQIREFQKKLDVGYISEYATVGDSYLYAVASNRNIKVNRRVK